MTDISHSTQSSTGEPVKSSRLEGLRHKAFGNSAPGGASECVRGPFGATYADVHAQGGVDEPVVPRAAAPELHREGAAKEEKPAGSPSASIADLLPLAVVSPASRVVTRAQRTAKRRRRDSENPKTKKLGFRCTAEQKTQIERLAAAADLNVADYLVRKALTEDLAGVTSRDERLERAIVALDAARGQLAPVGNNANQIAYRLNVGAGVEPGLAAAVLDRALALVVGVRTAVAEVDASAMRLARAKRR